MTRLTPILLVVLLLSIALLVVIPARAEPQAQAVCVPASTVNINAGVTLRVRARPQTGTILGSITDASNPLKVISVDSVSCWFRVEQPSEISVPSGEYWISNVSTYVSTVTPQVSRTPTPTLTATVTARPPTITPTRIVTNTPLAPGYIATQSTVLGREICFKPTSAPATAKGDCFLLRLDDVITDTIVQIQP